MEYPILVFALIGAVGIGAQWFAWRLNLPAIVLMAVAGILIGPVFNLVQPQEDFGEFYRPMISVAVAVILFEGGLQLKFDEIKHLKSGILRLVFPGVPLAWCLGTLASHYLGGLSWEIAVLFAGIMVVTGPTVIMPLLRQSKLNPRAGTLLKWEGIVNDPIGALLAVIVFEYLLIGEHGYTTFEFGGSLVIGSLIAVGIGLVLGSTSAYVFRRGFVPEYLKPAVLLSTVLVCFGIANYIQEEAGLISVTVMGIVMANSKMPSINDLRHFKENIAVLFVSGVFVILTANLQWSTFAAFDFQMLLFVLAMLFVVRPVSVMLATMGSELSLQERMLVSWIAPRGIVAVAVSSFFASALMAKEGFEDAERMIPMAFAMVFATVLAHGFTIRPLGKMLGLISRDEPGFLIVGASPWSIALAAKIKEMGYFVTVADDSYRALRLARQSGVPTYYGEILSEVTEHHIDLNKFTYMFAVGGNEAHNALVCTDLAPEMTRTAIFQLSARGKDDMDRKAVSYALQGQTLLSSGTGLDELLRRHYAGWTFQATKLSEEYGPEQYRKDIGPSAELVLIRRNDSFLVSSVDHPLSIEIGDTVLAYVPAEDRRNAKEARNKPVVESSKAVKEIKNEKKKALDEMGFAHNSSDGSIYED